ncbi:tRNA uridine-5-carboxymethylaminomethyl(34) synthesis GTPase MnmE [Ethanoligenens harbinense]|uniref:tRNA modification GTPase MnmE n=2 Tax=Ethanoligenens harbinense TaxID=253239 RepID=E6U8G8_ETHHY|nr:tRNA uridine-5-carboxymethylaminomethyl(34) synthesis GTPase MnmE [Ethanoligenens harbinense]ADU28287.1 tRNA modification GTPase TrmE [Ethanoligenens harbinense YUAN-3]
MQFEPIAAIATPHGTGGIGVIRLSGDGAFTVAQRVFHAKSGKALADMAGYTAAFGQVCDVDGPVDEAVVLVFRAPKSYTGEDVVEISCHGGETILRRTLAALLATGARLAGPGEFTRRAFLHGRIDLTEAEAVMQLIGAQSADAVRAAIAQHEGALYREIRQIKEILYQLSAELAAFFDYPDDDIPALTRESVLPRLAEVQEKLEKLCVQYETGRVLRDGVTVAIVGKPNVGKSTLMNRLLGEERSIVTEIAGTTRDVVEESAQFAGMTLHLFDTAGLRETDDPVERIGVARAKSKIEQAMLVFVLFDGSRPLDGEDESIFSMLQGKRVIAILNKADLPQRCDMARIRSVFPDMVSISAAEAHGMDALETRLRDRFRLEAIDPRAGMLANARQLDCALRAKTAVMESRQGLIAGFTLDVLSVGLQTAEDALAELTGEQASEAVIEKVFAQFCVGK